MIRTTIAAAALASAGMGLVMLTPDADETALADGTEFVTVDDDTQLDDAVSQITEPAADDAGPTIEPVVLEPTPAPGPAPDVQPLAEPAAPDTTADEDDQGRGDRDDDDDRRRGDRDRRADR